MKQQKSSARTADNERSQAAKGGRKSGSQGGRSGGEAATTATGQPDRGQSENARHGSQQGRKASAK